MPGFGTRYVSWPPSACPATKLRIFLIRSLTARQELSPNMRLHRQRQSRWYQRPPERGRRAMQSTSSFLTRARAPARAPARFSSGENSRPSWFSQVGAPKSPDGHGHGHVVYAGTAEPFRVAPPEARGGGFIKQPASESATDRPSDTPRRLPRPNPSRNATRVRTRRCESSHRESC